MGKLYSISLDHAAPQGSLGQQILAVDHLAKSHGGANKEFKVIDDVSFSVEKGEFLSIVGPSGCGKTTLLMCLAGLYSADGGSIRFLGQPITGPPAGVSVVFQDYGRSLLPWKNNLDNVLFGMRRVEGISKLQKREVARELLTNVGLGGFEDRYPWQISGGMQQRVAIARALATRPKLLLLDEPLAAVDAQTRAEMQDLILDLAKRFQQTCVLVTHDVDEAVYLANRVVVLSRRPTRVLEEVPVLLGVSRDQLETREDQVFLQTRHKIFAHIRAMKST